ncbi:MAG: tetratricopeptide repeat protein, partial [Vampirovibrionales bacterium]
MIFHKLITSVFETGKLKWASTEEALHRKTSSASSVSSSASSFKLKSPSNAQLFSPEALYEHWMEQAALAEVESAFHQAILAYKQASEIQRSNPEPYLEALRVCQNELTEPEMAMEWFQLALQECPLTLPLLERWCDFCIVQEKYDSAERVLRQGKALLKEDGLEITFLQAQLYKARGILGESLQLFQYVIREELKKPDLKPHQSPLVMESHMQCAQIYLELGNTEAGLRELQYLRTLNPHQLHVFQGLIYALLTHHQYREAAHVAREALQIFPDTPSLHYLLAQALEEDGRLDLAVSNYLHARRLQEEDTLYLLGLCFALRKMDRVQEGLEYLEVAYRKHPENKELYYPLGVFYLQTKQLERAEQFLELALKHHIEIEQVRPLLAMIWQHNPMKAKQALLVLLDLVAATEVA